MNGKSHIRSDWTCYSQYHIDFDRGIVVHSKSTSRGQLARYFQKTLLGGDLRHLTYPQLTDFHQKTETGELYLAYLKNLAITELGRGVFQASSSYIRNHHRVFDYPLNTMQYPVCQNTTIGYVRSLLDRQKIVDLITSLKEDTINFGQSRIQFNPEERKKSVVQRLRKIAFAEPQPTS